MSPAMSKRSSKSSAESKLYQAVIQAYLGLACIKMSTSLSLYPLHAGKCYIRAKAGAAVLVMFLFV